MWLSPWDNNVHGGDQLAHSLWALSTGGPWGSGPGWGDPEMIPAGNTDLVLPAIGEEWGFVGVAAVFLLFGFLVARALRAATRCRTYFGLFLALGLGCLIAYEMLLISAGVLGVLPLSGVVSPFLSSGNTAMLSNFLVFALLLSISADGQPGVVPYELLQRPTGYLKAVLACAMLVLLAAAARYQVLMDRDYLARDAHAFEADGVKRPQHNPRMNSLAREIPRGTIYDRNGIPVATSSWAELERHRQEYQALGISLDQAASRFDSRHYPFGAALALVLGDLRTGENFHASNASLVEHDSTTRLQGYEYAELAGLVRYRHQPGNPAHRKAAGAGPQCEAHAGRPAAIARQGNSGEAPARFAHSERRGGSDGCRHGRCAGAGELAGARSAGFAALGALARRAAGSHTVRAVSAGFDLQTGDRDCGAARRIPN